MRGDKFVISIVMVFAIGSPSCSKQTGMIPGNKLIIDTDAGTDDAVAIMMAGAAEALGGKSRIIGITCVNGNADVNDVTLNVLKTLDTIGRLDIPVYKGASHPLVLANTKDYYFGQDGFGDFNYPHPPSKQLIQQEHAVNALIRLVKKYPGEITLVALGPLTNIAMAIRLYPSFMKKLRRFIILGGSTEGLGNVKPGIEFNFYTDAEATYTVFNSTCHSNLPILVPWETTLKTQVTMEFRKSLSKLNNRKTWLLDSAEAISLDVEKEYWYCADAVAMAVALTSGSIVTKSGNFYSQIIWGEIKVSGMIMVDYTNIAKKRPNTNLAQHVDSETLEKLLWKTFSS